jgi:hypothetical protein
LEARDEPDDYRLRGGTIKAPRPERGRGWWRRRESNPRPKAPPGELLRACPALSLSPPASPAGGIRRAASPVGSRPFPFEQEGCGPACYWRSPGPAGEDRGNGRHFSGRQSVTAVGSCVFPGVLRGLLETSARHSSRTATRSKPCRPQHGANVSTARAGPQRRWRRRRSISRWSSLRRSVSRLSAFFLPRASATSSLAHGPLK